MVTVLPLMVALVVDQRPSLLVDRAYRLYKRIAFDRTGRNTLPNQ
jgi:hypothetical protein